MDQHARQAGERCQSASAMMGLYLQSYRLIGKIL